MAECLATDTEGSKPEHVNRQGRDGRSDSRMFVRAEIGFWRLLDHERLENVDISKKRSTDRDAQASALPATLLEHTEKS